MVRFTTVATCSLAQWALDFSGNIARIKESIQAAKARGAKFRLGPELEVCGYGCEDHFFENDTITHSWEALRELLESDLTDNIVCDVGMPVIHENVRYNCRVIILNRKIIMIRPKCFLADEGNYRESRWFTPWNRGFLLVDYVLPRTIRETTGQAKVKLGVGAICFNDTLVGAESCEELFTPNNPGIALGLGGVEILANGSGSHHELGKLSRRLELMCETTKKNGGLYMYSNQQGCDGSRMYFDGASVIVMNGKVLAQGTQFSMKDVEIVTATIDLTDIQNYRTAIASRGMQAVSAAPIPKVDADFYLCEHVESQKTTSPIGNNNLLSPEEEIAYGPACWLWDYLRRSKMNGFFLPLSGGADSAATAAMVGIMCQMLFNSIKTDRRTLLELRNVVKDLTFDPKSPQEICKRLFFTCYMGTKYSSDDTKNRAEKLARELGASFDAVVMDDMVEGCIKTWEQIGPTPDITNMNSAQNIACQNVQARCRMVFSYFFAQLALWRERPQEAWPGSLLVLGSANLDEGLRGYFTKYDCSSADINPIGALSKIMLKKFLVWAAENKGYPTLLEIATSNSSAELQPTAEDGKQAQVSEDEMGMSFEELNVFGKLRVESRCGPLSMFRKLVFIWEDKHEPAVVAEKVKRFFKYYAINRHKMTTITPSYHLESHGADDNRYDQRQFLYDASWSWQFAAIDRQVAALSRKRLRDQHSL